MKSDTIKNIMEGEKEGNLFIKYEVIRNDKGDIVSLKEIDTNDTIRGITNKHINLNKHINNYNKINGKWTNLKTFKKVDNGNEYAIIYQPIYKSTIINYLTKEVIKLSSLDVSINEYLKDYKSNSITYLNNDRIIVIR
jgi:hypothetical protein